MTLQATRTIGTGDGREQNDSGIYLHDLGRRRYPGRWT
jgi:hypothetical protein